MLTPLCMHKHMDGLGQVVAGLGRHMIISKHMKARSFIRERLLLSSSCGFFFYSYCSLDSLRSQLSSVLLDCFLFFYGTFLPKQRNTTSRTPPSIVMAAPADITIKNLNGEWTLVRTDTVCAGKINLANGLMYRKDPSLMMLTPSWLW